MAIDTYHENVAYLHRECEIYRAEGFQALSKIKICTNGQRILAVLHVVDDDNIIKADELGLSEQAFSQLNVKAGDLVTVDHAEPPESMDAVRRKINGERLNQEDYNSISRDIAQSRYSKMEMAAFLVATSQNNLDRDEILFLTRSMLESGARLNWHEALVADKHMIL